MSSQLDDHGQPVVTNFNKARNNEKAAYVLRGILTGIVANQQVTDSELLYLDEWIKKQQYMDLEGDSLDLVECVKDILKDGKISSEEMEDIKDLIDTVLTYGVPQSPYEEPRINEFFGLLKGICADEKLDLHEIDRIVSWINSNADLADKFPVEPVYDRIVAAKEDGVIDDDESTDLYALLTQLSGTSTGDDIHGSVASFFSDSIDGFDHTDQNLCFTGKFLFGSRKECEQNARDLGANTARDVSKKIDAVIIGTLTSRDWIFDNYGRKIEYAMKLRKVNGAPIILSEEQWISITKTS